MQSFALRVLLLTFLSAHIFAQGTSRLASLESQVTPIPSRTSSAIDSSYGPECTGCLLEALHPTPLSYTATVYCLNKTFISTVPSLIQYTTVAPDGCTAYITSRYTPTSGPISTTSITWSVSGTFLTWPTTYLAYSAFQAGTRSLCASKCTVHPTTVHVQSPIIYPATTFSGLTAPVPPQVVQSLIHDPSISFPFDIATCTAKNTQPGLLQAELQPTGSYGPANSTTPSCIQLPPITITLPNTFTQASTPLAQLLMARVPAEAAKADTHEIRQTSFIGLGIADGGFMTADNSVSGSTNISATTQIPSTANTTSSNRRSISGKSSTGNPSSSSSFMFIKF